MNTKATPRIINRTSAWLLGLAGLALFAAQASAQNTIDTFEVSQLGGKTVVRVTTKEPLKSVPPNFSVATPARIAFDFPNTVNALGRATQEIGQGELRSMNVVQGAERTRVVLNLRRSMVHEASLDGRALVVTLSAPAAANGWSAIGRSNWWRQNDEYQSHSPHH